MTITYDFDDNYFDYVPNNEDLTKALAICMIANAGGEETKENISLVEKIVSDHDFIYDDEIIEYYYDNLKEYFRLKAEKDFNSRIDI